MWGLGWIGLDISGLRDVVTLSIRNVALVRDVLQELTHLIGIFDIGALPFEGRVFPLAWVEVHYFTADVEATLSNVGRGQLVLVGFLLNDTTTFELVELDAHPLSEVLEGELRVTEVTALGFQGYSAQVGGGNPQGYLLGFVCLSSNDLRILLWIKLKDGFINQTDLSTLELLIDEVLGFVQILPQPVLQLSQGPQEPPPLTASRLIGGYLGNNHRRLLGVSSPVIVPFFHDSFHPCRIEANYLVL
jgi:hypothetical protein